MREWSNTHRAAEPSQGSVPPGVPSPHCTLCHHAASAETSTIPFACWPLLPPMIAAEGREPQKPVLVEVEDILLSAASARRRGVRLHQLPASGRRVVRPRLAVLLAAAALVVPAPADHTSRHWVVGQRRLVAHAGRDRATLQGTALDPGVRFLLQRRWRGRGECRTQDERDAQQEESHDRLTSSSPASSWPRKASWSVATQSPSRAAPQPLAKGRISRSGATVQRI